MVEVVGAPVGAQGMLNISLGRGEEFANGLSRNLTLCLRQPFLVYDRALIGHGRA